MGGLTLAIVIQLLNTPVQLCSICIFEHTIFRLIFTYEPQNRKCLTLIREFIFELNLLESAILNPTWADSQKKSAENWLN